MVATRQLLVRNSGPMERQVLGGAQYNPFTVCGYGAVGDSFILVRFTGSAQLADAFERMCRTGAQLSGKPIQGNSAPVTFGDDEQTAIRRDEKGFGVVRTVGVSRMENVFHSHRCFRPRRLLETIDRDALALGGIISDVRHIDA